MKTLEELQNMLWYLAVPYAGKAKLGFAQSNYYSAELMKRGIKLLAPISMTHPIHGALLDQGINFPPEFWYEFDNILLARCDGLIVCGEWKKSKGCRQEMALAEAMNMPVYEYNTFLKMIEKNDQK